MSSGNRHVLITGASGGIGSAVALALADRSTRLTLVARDPARLQAVAQRISAKAAGDATSMALRPSAALRIGVCIGRLLWLNVGAADVVESGGAPRVP